jgi:protein TonB
MSTFDLTGYSLSGDAAARKRWRRSFAVVLGLHASVAAVGLTFSARELAVEAPPPAILIDMTPTPPAPTLPRKVEEEVKPKDLPVVEKAEVVLKKVKPKPEPKPKPKEPEPQIVPQVQSPPAAPVVARSPVEARPAVMQNYMSVVFAHIEKYKKYPRFSGWRKPEGEVLLQLKFDRTGQVLAVSVLRSSGNAKLDEGALSAIRKANPLPPFPDSMKQAYVIWNMPVQFNIKD